MKHPLFILFIILFTSCSKEDVEPTQCFECVYVTGTTYLSTGENDQIREEYTECEYTQTEIQRITRENTTVDTVGNVVTSTYNSCGSAIK